MAERGIIKRSRLAKADGVVVLGNAELSKALTVTAHRFSKGAREKIEAAGGTVAIVPKREKVQPSAEA